MRTNSIDNKQLDFQSKGQLMKRFIRSNAEIRGGYLHPISKSPNKSPKVVDIYDGAVFAVFNQTVNTLEPFENATNSVSLQAVLKQQPSVVPYLVVFSGIAFLAMTLIWAMNGRIKEVGFSLKTAPFIEAEKVFKTAQPNHELKIILSLQFTEMADMKYQNQQRKKVQVVHTYRVVDILFKE